MASPNRALRLRLQAAANLALAKFAKAPEAELSAVAADGGVEVRLTVRPAGWDADSDMTGCPFLFTSFELLILQAVLGDPALTTKKLAARTGSVSKTDNAPTTKFKIFLARLLELSVLLRSDDDTYTVSTEAARYVPGTTPARDAVP